MRPAIIVTIGVVAAFAMTMWFLWVFWKDQLPSEISVQGWIALGAGCGLTVVIAGVSVVLMQISHRGGYDQRVGLDRPYEHKTPWNKPDKK